MRLSRKLWLIALAIFILSGFGASIQSRAGAWDSSSLQSPEMKDSAYHSDMAQGNNGAYIDTSCTSQGYVAVSATSGSRLKFQVLKGDATYNYDLRSDGTPSIFPLQCGDGTYLLRVMENIVDSKYAELYSTECNVTLDSEFEPFLRPSDYVFYHKYSQCVKKAQEMAGSSGDELELIGKVYDYVTQNIKYDKDKAATIKAGYLPSPDETIATGKGICFDYASLASAMLRSQGIPTKVIFGYVSPNDVYHAWNMFYTEQTGWVVVSYEAKGNVWNRMDLTFAAGGAPSSFVGDGSNYAELYVY